MYSGDLQCVHEFSKVFKRFLTSLEIVDVFKRFSNDSGGIRVL